MAMQYKDKLLFKVIAILLALTGVALAEISVGSQSPRMVSSLSKAKAGDYCMYKGMYIFAQDSKEQYLGLITDNEFSTESIINEFGSYGSELSSTSIRNELSPYGSELSSYSAYNSLTSTPPIIYRYDSANRTYVAVAYLTKNTFKTPAVDPDLLIATMQVGCTAPPAVIVDLVVDSLTAYSTGDSIHVGFIVANHGDVDISSSFAIRLYNNDQVMTSWTSDQTLRAGYYYTLDHSFRTTSNVNVIEAFVDADLQISEDFEFNNSLSKTVYASIVADTTDLAIDSFKVEYSDDTLWFSYNMQNKGNTKIPPGMVCAIYLNGQLDLTTEPTGDTLFPFYYYPFSFFVTNFTDSIMKIRVCIDYENALEEMLESNNCDSGSAKVDYEITSAKAVGMVGSAELRIMVSRNALVISNPYPVCLDASLFTMSGKRLMKIPISPMEMKRIHWRDRNAPSGSYVLHLTNNGSVLKTMKIQK